MATPTPLAVSATFTLHDLGWADLTLQIGEESFTVRGVSYTTDALGDLVRFALALAVGSFEAECSFDGEPMETRLRGVSDSVTVDFSVYELDDIYSNRPVEEGDRVFFASCRTDALATAIASAAEGVLNEVGSEGYKSAWGDNFPTRALTALKAALSVG